MKTPEQLVELEHDISAVYGDRVEVEQDDTGRLLFTYFGQSLLLSPWGEAPIGVKPDSRPELWKYELDGYEGEPPIGTLNANFVAGFFS